MRRSDYQNLSKPPPSTSPFWENWSDSKLLRTPIRDLHLSLAGSFAEKQIEGLYRDLTEAGLRYFRPPVYLADEWFSPDGAPVIAIPFFLAHPRLTLLERRLMRIAEGGTSTWCRRLLRHEAGHAFDHAYRVSERACWQKIFGDRSKPYKPERYTFDRSSQSYVRHLAGFYAQAHPDEDFAETFAVCITPRADWRRRYKAWPLAYAKLVYVSSLIREYGNKYPTGDDDVRDFSACRLRRSLARYYERRIPTHSSLS